MKKKKILLFAAIFFFAFNDYALIKRAELKKIFSELRKTWYDDGKGEMTFVLTKMNDSQVKKRRESTFAVIIPHQEGTPLPKDLNQGIHSPKLCKKNESCYGFKFNRDVLVVGKVTFKEYTKSREGKSPFTLKEIEIFPSMQGQKLGDKAMQKVLTLFDNLAEKYPKDPMYKNLGLRCTDIACPTEGQDLTFPTRLAFYSKRGAILDSRAKKLINFLSVRHMIEKFDVEQLRAYLHYYFKKSPLHSVVNELTDNEITNMRQQLLDSNLFHNWEEDELLQIAESDCTASQTDVLDRAYYEGSVSDQYQEANRAFTYKLTYPSGQANRDVKIEERNALLNKRQQNNNPRYKEELQRINWPYAEIETKLAPQQILLNQELEKLLKEKQGVKRPFPSSEREPPPSKVKFPRTGD